MASEVQWFPMRVTYNREMKAKDCFDKIGMESFVPMRYELVEKDGRTYSKLQPAIHNLIFVHSTQKIITDLKISSKEFTFLRYIMNNRGEERGVMTVPDREMENFIQVASVGDNSIFYLDNNDFINKVGRKVRITAGKFKDVTGIIKRIKRNRHVVVQIDGVAAIAITYIPKEFIEYTDID